MRKKLIVGTLGFLMAQGLAFADGDHDHDETGTAIEDTMAAAQVGVEKFEVDNPALKSKFAGVKAWPVQGGIKVKVYLDQLPALTYSCHQHAPELPVLADPVVAWECHLQ